jgi:hypothetical protein
MPTSRLTLLLSHLPNVSALRLAGPLSAPIALAFGIGFAGCAGNDGVTPAGGGTSGFGTAGTAGGGGAAGSAGASPGGAAMVGGSAGLGGASGGSGGAGIEPTFAMLKDVIKMSCFGGVCHDLPEHPFKLILDDKLYATLTTHMTKTCGPVVKPGSPQDSALVKLLKGPCGETERMPLNKCVEDTDEGCVRPEYIAAIEQWIAKGAPQ